MSLSSEKEMISPIWSQIEALVANVPGWTPLDQLFALYTLAWLTSGLSGDIVEVGSWCGRSAVVLGAAAKASGNSIVHCVDLFPSKNDWKQKSDGSYFFEVVINGKHYAGYHDQSVWKETFESQILPLFEIYNGIYDHFIDTVSSRGMSESIRPHQGDLASLLTQLGPGFQCRLAFLDGGHGYETVSEDIRNIDKHLIPGGWLCFDDAFTSYDGVSRAITELVIKNPEYGLCQQLTRKLFVAQKKCR